MARALADIDLALRRCSVVLRNSVTEQSRAQARANMDTLLDERFTARPVKPNTGTCKHCYGHATVRRLTTLVVGATPAEVLDCPECDRARCKPCGTTVKDRYANRCPAGHWLDRNQT